MKWALVFLVFFAACKKEAPADDAHAALVSALAEALEFHVLADDLEKRGDYLGAVKVLRGVDGVLFPRVPEAQDVRLDTRARVAMLLLKSGDAAAAEREIDAALDGVVRESYFVANLHTARGEILEAQGKKNAAIEAYDVSLKMNDRIQERLVESKR